MTDVVIQSGDTLTRSVTPPPTVHVELPPPTAPADGEMLPQDGGDVVLKRVSDPIDSGPDGSGLREALRREREEAQQPLVEWSGKNMPVPGDHESHARQIKRASESMTRARQAAAADELVKEGAGYITPDVAATVVDTLKDLPPAKVGIVTDNGNLIAPLRDDEPLTLENSFQSIREMRRGVKQYRDLQDQQRAALLQEFANKQAEDAKVAADLERIEAERRAQQQVTTPPQAPPTPVAQQQPDPLVANVRAVEQQIVNADRQSAHEQQQIQQWAVATFPPEVLRDSQARAELQRTDPNAAEWLRIADQRFAQLQNHRQRLRQVDTGQKIQAAGYLQQQAAIQLEARNKAQDTEFQRLLEQEMPEFAKGRGRQEMMAAAKKLVESQPEIMASYQQGGPARNPAAQMTIARAAAWQVAQERARNLNAHKRVPPVHAPGTYQPRGAGDIDQVRALERQLDGATGQQALKIAKALTQARRAAGML